MDYIGSRQDDKVGNDKTGARPVSAVPGGKVVELLNHLLVRETVVWEQFTQTVISVPGTGGRLPERWE